MLWGAELKRRVSEGLLRRLSGSLLWGLHGGSRPGAGNSLPDRNVREREEPTKSAIVHSKTSRQGFVFRGLPVECHSYYQFCVYHAFVDVLFC